MNILENKRVRSAIGIYAVAIMVIVLLYIIVPIPKQAATWISFVSTIISVLFSLYAGWVAFRKCEQKISTVYALPVFRVGLVYVLVQLAVLLVICTIGCFVTVPYWIALVLSIILLGLAIIGVIVTDNTRDTIEKVETQMYDDTKVVTQFQINISSIVNACEDNSAREKLQELNLAFLYSDPVSSDATTKIEETISAELVELKKLVETGNVKQIIEKTSALQRVLAERNDLCKAYKYTRN